MDDVIEFDFDTAKAYVTREAEGESATVKQVIQAWAYLIGTEDIWSMSKNFINSANMLIESGVISEDGEINWTIYSEVYDGEV